MGYSPWGRKELDTTERLHFHFHMFSLSSSYFFTLFTVPFDADRFLIFMKSSLSIFYLIAYAFICMKSLPKRMS